MKHLLAPAFLVGTALAGAPAWATEGTSPADGEIIVVKGQLIDAELAAWSTTTLDNQDIRHETVSDLDDLLRLIPGVVVRDFGLGGVASSVVIRGFGGGSHGGDLGAVLDGIPLNEAMSHADGYFDLNIIVPLEVQTLTVYRGPVSALYGNFNRGGLLRIDTRKGSDYADADLLGGSFETFDLQLAGGRELGRLALNGAAHLFTSDGYRPRSTQSRQTVAGRVGFDLTPDVQLAVSGRNHSADAESASYLTLAQFETDPYGIDPNVQNDGAVKDFATGRADLNIAFAPSVSLVSFAYLTRQDFTRWFTRPIGAGTWRQREESYDRRVFGVGTSLNGTLDLAGASAPINYVAGVELFRERTDFLFFDGLDNRRPTAPPANDRDTRLNSISAYGEAQIPVADILNISLGLRADRFTGRCQLLGPETGTDPCGELDDISELSPKLGIRAQLAGWVQLRAGWSKGFALPNNFVKYSVGAQVLEPNVFRQTEIGVTLSPLAGLTLDTAAFRLASTQEVRTVAPGIFENFGATRRQGIETSAEWQVTPAFWVRGVYSYVETEVRENGTAALVGNAVPGVPNHSANIDVTWRPIENWSVLANWRHVGSYEVNPANTLRSDAYDTFDLGVAYDATSSFADYQLYLRVNNVTDEVYATSVSIIGGQTLVAPAAPRTVRAGIKVTL